MICTALMILIKGPRSVRSCILVLGQRKSRLIISTQKCAEVRNATQLFLFAALHLNEGDCPDVQGGGTFRHSYPLLFCYYLRIYTGNKALSKDQSRWGW